MHRDNIRRRLADQSGIALVSAILVMLLMSALLVGFLALIASEQKSSFHNRDQTVAYAAAHGGLEQLTANLGQLFSAQYRPTNAQVNALTVSQPTFPANMGVQFLSPGGTSGYQIKFTDANGDGFPDTEAAPRTINDGPYQGLQGIATPFEIEVTAQTATGGESRMRRKMFTMLIPAFQFGVFSDNDLSFFAGPNFDFGGAVHTNQNLFLAEGDGSTLYLRNRVTAVGEIVRTNLSNGWLNSSNYNGTVNVARYDGDTTGDTLLQSEGSWAAAAPQLPPAPLTGVIPAPGENQTPNWTTTSVTKFRGNLKNARTGAKPLVLPLVQLGALPIDLLRRPVVNSAEDTANPSIYAQRYYARASVRILLSDTMNDIKNLPGVTAADPIDLTTLLGNQAASPAWYKAVSSAPIAAAPSSPSGWWDQSVAKYTNAFPVGAAVAAKFYPGYPGYTGTPTAAQSNIFYSGLGEYIMPQQPTITGFIKIELQHTDGTWLDVTQDILKLGFTGRRLSKTSPGTTSVAGFVLNGTTYYLNDYVWGTAPDAGTAPPCNNISPNAVIRLQRVRDDHNPLRPCGFLDGTFTNPSQNQFDYIPNVLFDTREGNLRDANATTVQTATLGGAMSYIELDVQNLARWLAGTIGAGGFGPTAEFSDGGYVVYISDRRTNQRPAAGAMAGKETGEFGMEDVINPADANGVPNNVLDQGEDVNGVDMGGTGSNLDTYGGVPIVPVSRAGSPVDGASTILTAVSSRVARSNPPLFYRRAVKIANGAGTTGNSGVSPLTVLPAGRGLTIVVENPVYVEGNYNVGVGTAPAGGFGTLQTDHRPSAIIADAVTLLSNGWNDLRSFTYMNTACTGTAPYANTCYGADDPSKRAGNDTWYRMAIVAGKGLSFTKPGWADSSKRDFGTDGGAHNFLRYLETGGRTVNYRGSIISFYTARQAIGTYKCCTNVYGAPSRGYKFDTEFLQLSLLPPKSPAFRDVNTYTFRQVLRPTQ